MKYLLNVFFIFLIMASCNSQQSDTVKQAKEVQTVIQENRPGTKPTADGSWTMTAKLDGKNWEASSIMPPATAGRIVGYYGKEYIGLPYNKSDMVVGKKNKFGEDNAVDLATNGETGMWGGRKGEMEITKVKDDWVEGTFYFTADATGTDKTVEVTDGFFRIRIN